MTIYFITLPNRDNTPEQPVGGSLFPDLDVAVSQLDSVQQMQPEKDYRLMAATVTFGKPVAVEKHIRQAARERNARRCAR